MIQDRLKSISFDKASELETSDLSIPLIESFCCVDDKMKLEELENEYCSQLQRGHVSFAFDSKRDACRSQLTDSLLIAKRTAEFLRTHIVHNRHPTAESLIQDIKQTGSRLQQAKPIGSETDLTF